MRAVIQRVKWGRVKVKEKLTGEIVKGLVILLGVSADDTEKSAKYLADKCINLRIFNDSECKMNLSLLDIKGEILSISQFTLYADTRKGRRPSFINAADPAKGEELYEKYNISRLLKVQLDIVSVQQNKQEFEEKLGRLDNFIWEEKYAGES